MSDLLKLEDVLGEASSFTHAIFLAAAGLGDSQDTNAIQLIADELSQRLEKACCIIDDIRALQVIPAGMDPSEVLQAVRAEKARRASLNAGENANG